MPRSVLRLPSRSLSLVEAFDLAAQQALRPPIPFFSQFKTIISPFPTPFNHNQIVCEPEPVSLMMGGLHPRASLYERPVNLDAAKAAHAEFRRVMREAGVKARYI